MKDIMRKLIVEEGYNQSEAARIAASKMGKHIVSILVKTVKGVKCICGKKGWHTV